MNIKQLERLKVDIAGMRTTLEEDRQGVLPIEEEIDKLEVVVLEELKVLVWGRYLEREAERET